MTRVTSDVRSSTRLARCSARRACRWPRRAIASAAHYTHCFFDEEELLAEFERAGLALVARKGFRFTLQATDPGALRIPEDADSFAMEVTRATLLVRAVDVGRAIGWVDALGPGGASCNRRILLETALDAGAARETVVFGLDVGRTGHVAFEDREERTFDVSFAIPG